MQNSKKLKKLKIILILILFFSFFPITFIFTLLRDVPVLSSLINRCCNLSNSIFIPNLPYIDLLFFLPEFQFSLGQLIDIIIIFNIICYIESSIYHYIKIAYLNGEYDIINYLDSCFLEFIEKSPDQFQDPAIVFGLKDDVRYLLINKLNIERNCRIKDRNGNFYRFLKKKRYGSYFIQNGTKSKYKLNNYYENLQYFYYSVFEKFLIFHLKNQYPIIKFITHSNELSPWEGG